MTIQEAQEAIKDIPLGSKVQLVKTNGDIVEVKLMSKEVEGIPGKVYEQMSIPELPPALTVVDGARFGKYRIDIDDIVKIAWIE